MHFFLLNQHVFDFFWVWQFFLQAVNCQLHFMNLLFIRRIKIIFIFIWALQMLRLWGKHQLFFHFLFNLLDYRRCLRMNAWSWGFCCNINHWFSFLSRRYMIGFNFNFCCSLGRWRLVDSSLLLYVLRFIVWTQLILKFLWSHFCFIFRRKLFDFGLWDFISCLVNRWFGWLWIWLILLAQFIIFYP